MNFPTRCIARTAVFALLRGDGYVVEGYADPFTDDALERCGLLVIANPLAEENEENWDYPHESAFSGDEIREVMEWVRGGGRLLLFADRTLIDHPIRQGRLPVEPVDSLVTFTGQAFQLTEGWEPLVVFGPEARAFINLSQAFQDGNRTDWPGFSVAGWAHGAAREWDAGRAVFMGEAAMCSAQIAGPQRRPMGMNEPVARQNPQFCLNLVRWLTGVIG